MQELAMTKEQYEKVMQEIQEHHAFGKYVSDDEKRKKQKYIKYVRPNWDMRDIMCFSIRFDGLTCGREGKEFNSGYGETVPLFDQVMAWLYSPLPPPIIHTGKTRG